MLGKHSVGIYEKAFDPKISWEERLDRAGKLGFDYVEISIDETDDRLARLDWNKEQKKQLLDAIWNSGVDIRSMCLSAHRRFPFGSKFAAVRDNAHLIMEKAIDFAGELGIRVIQLAGYDVYYEESTEEDVYEYAILKTVMEDGEEILVSVDDDEEFDDIADYFDDLFATEIDYDQK